MRTVPTSRNRVSHQRGELAFTTLPGTAGRAPKAAHSRSFVHGLVRQVSHFPRRRPARADAWAHAGPSVRRTAVRLSLERLYERRRGPSWARAALRGAVDTDVVPGAPRSRQPLQKRLRVRGRRSKGEAMRVSSCGSVCLVAVVLGGVSASACSSTQSGGFTDAGNSSSSGSSSSGSGSGSSSSSGAGSSSSSSSSSGAGSSSSSSSSSSGAASSSSSSSSSSGAGSSSSSSSGAGPSDAGSSSSSSSGAGAADGGVICAAGLQDKITTCTGTEPTCLKGCGPNLPTSGNLGSKACSCNTAAVGGPTYLCAACMYPQPLMPACYAPPLDAGIADPPPCAAGVADKGACTPACSGNTSGICTITTDAGKVDGCVCVQLATTQWTCQTQWW
jgi:hypothetical protein